MNEVSGGAVILAVLFYLAKSLYELVKSKNGNGNGKSPTVNNNGSVHFDGDVKKCIYDTQTLASNSARIMEKVEDKMTQMVQKQEITNTKLDQFIDLLRDIARK